MKRSRWTAVGLALVVCATAGAGQAQQLKNENLLVGMPQGFKLGFKDSKNGMNMQEFVPADETVQNWTEMVTRPGVSQPQGPAAGPNPRRNATAVGGRLQGQQRDAGRDRQGERLRRRLDPAALSARGVDRQARDDHADGDQGQRQFLRRAACRAIGSDTCAVRTMKKYIESVSVCDSRLPSRACPTVK
jgi:hypothetical protein